MWDCTTLNSALSITTPTACLMSMMIANVGGVAPPHDVKFEKLRDLRLNSVHLLGKQSVYPLGYHCPGDVISYNDRAPL